MKVNPSSLEEAAKYSGIFCEKAMFDPNDELIYVDDGLFGILILKNNNYESITLVKRIEVNGFTGKSRLLIYPGKKYLIVPDRDIVYYLLVVDITIPE